MSIRSIECNHCGEKGLHWTETSVGWRLFDADGNQHHCQHAEPDADGEDTDFE